MNEENKLDIDDNFFNDIDFDAIEKKNEERIKELDDEVPEADNDCGDSCKI